jgi:hypothetical protein
VSLLSFKQNSLVIAVEHELDWDPATAETEFFKKHEDLLVSIILQ